MMLATVGTCNHPRRNANDRCPAQRHRYHPHKHVIIDVGIGAAKELSADVIDPVQLSVFFW